MQHTKEKNTMKRKIETNNKNIKPRDFEKEKEELTKRRELLEFL